MKLLRRIGLLLVLWFAMGFAFGLVLRTWLERPVVYIGGQPPELAQPVA